MAIFEAVRAHFGRVFLSRHHAESDADMPLRSCLSRTWSHIQGALFPWLTEELGPRTETHKRVVTALEVAGVVSFVRVWPGLPGRPPCDRAALARAFVAKAVIGLPTTAMLIDRLTVDKPLRRLCGWEHRGELPAKPPSRALLPRLHAARCHAASTRR